MGNIIAVSANKGGSLKTSISTNLAGVISKNGKKVCLIDLDNQGNVAITFGKNPDDLEYTIYDVLVDDIDPFAAIINVSDNLDIIAANDDMAYLEIDVLTKVKKYPKPLNLLSKSIEKLKEKYDYIIIDTPPQMGMIAANVFNCAEDIIIPYHPEVYSFRSMVKSMKAIKQFQKDNENLKIKAVVPVKVKKTLTHEAFLDSGKALCEQNDVYFSNTVISESIKYTEAVGRYRKPITLATESSKVIDQYSEIYNKLTKELDYIG
ncbi:ParA family protein [Listeria valentina]|uniref:ParA family protein n=1 Tax=Listeria valentina TaxID=2705293 RepID=UPI00142FF813|nr:ParA family protein [Listeria valentina]